MHVRESKRTAREIRKALEAALENGDETWLMDECLGKAALHHVSQSLDELEDLGDVDLWDLKVDGFEEGLMAARKLRPGQRIYTVFAGPADLDVARHWCFWFAVKDERELVQAVRRALAPRKDGARD